MVYDKVAQLKFSKLTDIIRKNISEEKYTSAQNTFLRAIALLDCLHCPKGDYYDRSLCLDQMLQSYKTLVELQNQIKK